MIVTAQPFFNELDLLEIKFETLLGIVDAHIVVEADRTFTGNPKPLHFYENRFRFEKYPVIHVTVKLPEISDSAWDRERLQYQAVRDVVKAICPEIALWLDADECPKPDTVERFRNSGNKCATIEMDQLLHYFNRCDTRGKWTNSKIGFYDQFANEQPWRGMTGIPVLNDSGWHFETFGDKSAILEKLHAYSHFEDESCKNYISKVAKGFRPGFSATVDYPEEKLPRFVTDNRVRFSKYFLEREELEKMILESSQCPE